MSQRAKDMMSAVCKHCGRGAQVITPGGEMISFMEDQYGGGGLICSKCCFASLMQTRCNRCNTPSSNYTQMFEDEQCGGEMCGDCASVAAAYPVCDQRDCNRQFVDGESDLFTGIANGKSRCSECHSLTRALFDATQRGNGFPWPAPVDAISTLSQHVFM
jgi:hypothetical protein